jgi:ADP-ribosyl-[dinitrogen reductase] hydrolase
MIAARLMVELGIPADQAIAEVRKVRPGAIETAAQERHVQACRPVPERQPSTSADAIRDRAVGALLGLAVGDAIGTTLEFKSRDTYPLLTDMIGGGPCGLKRGQWTDDTAMALALADSLAACGGIDEQDMLARFVDWWRRGTYSCTGSCFDIGGTTAQALRRWETTKADHCGSTDPASAGNGSLMRLSPVAIRFWKDRPALRDAAARLNCDNAYFLAEQTANKLKAALDQGLRPSKVAAYREAAENAVAGRTSCETSIGTAVKMAVLAHRDDVAPAPSGATQ